MRLAKSTHDQMRILIFVARASEEPIPVSTIASRLDFPRPNALKLINRLVHAGLLRAQRGRRGGVVLARPASQIKLGAAISLLERANAKAERSDWSILDVSGGSSNILETALSLFVDVLDQHTLSDITTRAPGRSANRRPRAIDGRVLFAEAAAAGRRTRSASS